MHALASPRSLITTLFATLCAIACGEDQEKQAAGTLGASCTPHAGCTEPLECTERGDEHFCTHAAGDECRPEDSKLTEGGCAENAECIVAEDAEDPSVGRCLLDEGAECDPDEPHCQEEYVCAEMTSGGNRCYAPVVFVGRVVDTKTGEGIAGAHVIALDSEGSAATSVSITDPNGDYSLEVPVVRNDDGRPIDDTFTLDGSAQNYQSFPAGVRVALPITTRDADLANDGYVVDNALTQIGLIPLEAESRQVISGTITPAEVDDRGHAMSDVTGVLVVASDGTRSFSGTTDKDGNFTIFNVEDGEYEVRAYAADLQVTPESVDVQAEDVGGVTLKEEARGTVTVGGNVQIVNAPGGSETSVILVVQDTFDADAARGEVPRGLRAPKTGVPNVSGDFAIEGVPDGNYVVLAAYENDELVRDPDTNIAGTDFVTIVVDGTEGPSMTISESFKVTEALEIFGPGPEGPEAVSSAPTLSWADDSSEDWYEVRVFDAFGDEVWSSLDVSSVSGSDSVDVEYDGPLEVGMYYQFRVQSWRQPGGGDAAPISATEDLRGVFFKPAP